MSLSIGTSGFSYSHWRGIFYPEEVPQSKWLEYYCRHFSTLELNVTFYRLPKVETFKSWYQRTPPDFRFAVKGSRFITHIKRLRDCEAPLEFFFKRAAALGDKLAVILWQFPESFQKDEKRFIAFVRLLKKERPLRHAFEFRDATWLDKSIRQILVENEFSLCLADWPELEVTEPLASSFIYLRRRGEECAFSPSK